MNNHYKISCVYDVYKRSQLHLDGTYVRVFRDKDLAVEYVTRCLDAMNDGSVEYEIREVWRKYLYVGS